MHLWVLTDDISGYLLDPDDIHSDSDLVMPVVEKPMGIFLQGDANLYIVDPCEDIVKVAEGNSYQVIWYDRAMFHRSLKDRSLWFLHRFWTELVDVAGDEDNCSYDEHVRMLKPNELITGALN
ncbi:hypothetical protein SPFM12_00072 [Salmonella phage SPFM12]|nr:hypothetical protein SPFM12_00072 [Salmonella phage SPFM12]